MYVKKIQTQGDDVNRLHRGLGTMATFVLKKYSDKEEDTNNKIESNPDNPKGTGVRDKNDAILHIDATSSVSAIVAQALHKTLANKSIDIDIIEGKNEEEGLEVIKTISSEDINNDPVATLRSIGENDVVFIASEGFSNRTEDWFLYNLGNKTTNVFYTVEAFMDFIDSKFAMEEESDTDLEEAIVSSAEEGEAIGASEASEGGGGEE